MTQYSKQSLQKYPKITLSLINAFLEFQGTEQLVDIEFIDREIDSDECEGKESRLDILGRTASGTKVNIEMQVNLWRRSNSYVKANW